MNYDVTNVPDVVIDRLPQYMRALKTLQDHGATVISSQVLGTALQMTPAQIRKDLSYFGRFGKQGRGYDVPYLITELREILRLDRDWNITVIGVGRLGKAIISYPGFGPEGFKIAAAFDSDPKQVGQNISGLIVQPMSELESTIRRHNIQIAIVAVPATHAANVITQLISSGITSILNYAPVTPYIPNGIKVRNIDPVSLLQTMTFYLK